MRAHLRRPDGGEGARSNRPALIQLGSTRLPKGWLILPALMLALAAILAAAAHAHPGAAPAIRPSPAAAPATAWNTFATARFGYALEYPPFLSPAEQANQSPGGPTGVPSDIAFGHQLRVISRMPPLPDAVVRRYWPDAPTVDTAGNLTGRKLERISWPIGGGDPVVTTQYLFRSPGADYVIVASLPTNPAEQDLLDQAAIERMVRSFRILPGRQAAALDQTTAAAADAFDFFLDPPDGGTRAPDYASYNVQNPYLTYWSTCYNKYMYQLQHAAEDWFRAGGTNVYAVANGRVVWANYANWPGAVVIIEHSLDNGWTNPWGENVIYSVYGHLSTSGLVSQWSDVTRGQVIGQVYYQAANSHIHFEMRRYGDMTGVLVCPATGYSSWPGPGYTNTNVDPGTYGYTNPSAWIDSHRAPACYDLQVAVNPLEAGRVEVSPPPDCSSEGQYRAGTDVTLAALEDDPAYTFFSWSGDSEDAAFTNKPILLTMDQHRAVTASFVPADEALLSVVPVDVVVPLGGETEVTIAASSISGLAGVQIALQFDPAKVAVVDADASTEGVQVVPGSCPAPDFVVANNVDNEKGMINYAAASLAPSPPCSGGPLMDVSFRGLAAAEAAPLHFIDWQLSDYEGLAIPANARGGTLAVVAARAEGKVLLQGRDDYRGVTICAAANDETSCVQTGADGLYALALAPGDYLVTIAMERYLNSEKNITVAAGQPTLLPDFISPGGDVNDDCVINIFDLVLVGSRFGSSSGDDYWDPRADINDDGAVNVLDLVLTGANFNKACPAAWP